MTTGALPSPPSRARARRCSGQQGLPWGVLAEKGLGQSGAGGTHLPLPAQDGAFGVEGTDLWLAASGDQRVSIWSSSWLRDCCELVDWLSFPAPILMEVRVPGAPQAGTVPAQLATPHVPFLRLQTAHRPPSLPSVPGIGRCWCVRASAHIQRWSFTASARSRHVHAPCDPGRGGSWAVYAAAHCPGLDAHRW